MMDRKDLKTKAKLLVKEHYWPAVFAGLILVVCSLDSFLFSNNTGIEFKSSDPNLFFPKPSEILELITDSSFFYAAMTVLFVTFFFSVFIGNPMEYGARNWFYHVSGKKKNEEQNILFSAFHRGKWLRISSALLWKNLVVILWGLLLIVPGVIKSYEYKFVVYILEDHPMMSTSDVMKYAKNLSNGHKMELFKLDLSFFGWFLLQIVTLDLAGIFYAGPYFYQTQALAYRSIKESIEQARRMDSQNKYKKNKKKKA